MDPATERLAALLAPFTNYERLRPDRPRWTLETMRALLELPGQPSPEAPLVQVGGSKGKGTTTLYLEALGRACGLRTGAYVSPHLQSLLERVRLDGRPVAEAVLQAELERLAAAIRERALETTFFEVMTAAGLACFARARVDLGVLEVGLGGRLDATTAVPVAASILTGVELEHTELLGDTVEAIAAEKAFILREGGFGLTAAAGSALEVVRARAARVGCELAVLGEAFGLEDVVEEGDIHRGVIRDIEGRAWPFVLEGAARFELAALCLALVCLRRLRPDLVPPLEPVPRPVLAGRCELVCDSRGTVLLLDGAHTPASLAALRAELERRFPRQRLGLLFGCAAGKRWREGLSHLVDLLDITFVTSISGTPSADPEEIADWLRTRGVRAVVARNEADGLERLAARGGPGVVTGSFYLVGAVRALTCANVTNESS